MTAGVDAVGHSVVVGSVVRLQTPTASYWGVEYVSRGGRVAVVRNVHGRRSLVDVGAVVTMQEAGT